MAAMKENSEFEASMEERFRGFTFQADDGNFRDGACMCVLTHAHACTRARAPAHTHARAYAPTHASICTPT
jgi:hypothetical protein